MTIFSRVPPGQSPQTNCEVTLFDRRIYRREVAEIAKGKTKQTVTVPTRRRARSCRQGKITPHTMGRRSCDKSAVVKIAAAVAAACFVAGCATDAKAVNTSSLSYKKGLESGTTGLAEIEAFKGTSYNEVCDLSFEIESGGAPDLHLNRQDYMAGCSYGLSHQSVQWTQMRKSK